jgi:hypothetical protein
LAQQALKEPRSKIFHAGLVPCHGITVAQRGDVVPPLPLGGLDAEELRRSIDVEGTHNTCPLSGNGAVLGREPEDAAFEATSESHLRSF